MNIQASPDIILVDTTPDQIKINSVISVFKLRGHFLFSVFYQPSD
jgi:hypothetical protein